MVEILKAVLYGIVEGITEWLPVSSTGHLILLNEFIPMKVSQEFWNMFEVVIQLGAILAVVVMFWSRIFPFGKKDNLCPAAAAGPGACVKMDVLRMWLKIIIASIPGMLIIPFNDALETKFSNYQTVAVMLILVGAAFIAVENWNKNRTAKVNSIADITWWEALIIGVFQLIAAIFPGTSRSGATIIGGLLLGVARPAAAEFTFYLAIPAMFGASLIKLIHFGAHFTTPELMILIIGMGTAFLVSIFAIRFLMEYIRKHDFKIFGWYRIALGAAVLLYFTLK